MVGLSVRHPRFAICGVKSLLFMVPVEDKPVELELPWKRPGRWGSSPGFLPDLASRVC